MSGTRFSTRFALQVPPRPPNRIYNRIYLFSGSTILTIEAVFYSITH